MKKIILLFVATLFCNLASEAQNLNYSPSKAINHQIINYDVEEVNMLIGLNSTSDVTFEWTLIENTLPAIWSYSLCDLGHCFFAIPNQGTMDPLSKAELDTGDKAFFKFTFMLGETDYGKGIVRIYVYDQNDINGGDTVSFEVEYAEPNGILSTTNSNFEVYPNPGNSHFTIVAPQVQNVQYTLINNQGQVILKGTGKDVNIAGLSKGVYFLQLNQSNGIQSTRKVLIN